MVKKKSLYDVRTYFCDRSITAAILIIIWNESNQNMYSSPLLYNSKKQYHDDLIGNNASACYADTCSSSKYSVHFIITNKVTPDVNVCVCSRVGVDKDNNDDNNNKKT